MIVHYTITNAIFDWSTDVNNIPPINNCSPLASKVETAMQKTI